MKIGLLINYWDDPQGLIRLFDSPGLLNYIYKVIIRDGKYSDRDDRPRYKQVLTQGILSNYCGKIDYTHNHDTETQVEKRNKLFESATEHKLDYAIVIDSDEYVELEDDILIPDESYSCYRIPANNRGQEQYLPRLFKAPFDYRFIDRHSSLYKPDGKEVIYESHHSQPMIGFKIIHDHDLRHDDRTKNNREYYKNIH